MSSVTVSNAEEFYPDLAFVSIGPDSRLPDRRILEKFPTSQHGRSTLDETVLLTQHIEDSFETKKKAGAVFVDLTAAYDTVWHRGLSCKLLRLLPDKHMVQMIMELIRNRSFTLSIGDSKRSRLRRLQNGLPQGSVLAPLLFNIYTYDLPSTISQKYAVCVSVIQCVCRRPGIDAYLERLEDFGGHFKPRHDNAFSVSPDLEAEAQPH